MALRQINPKTRIAGKGASESCATSRFELFAWQKWLMLLFARWYKVPRE